MLCNNIKTLKLCYNVVFLFYCFQVITVSMCHFFMNTIISIFQFTHLISKTPGLEIFKTLSTIFVSLKLAEILQNLTNFNSFDKSKLSRIFDIFLNFKTKKSQTTLWKDLQTYNHVFTLSLPCLKYQKSKTTLMSYLNSHFLGHPVFQKCGCVLLNFQNYFNWMFGDQV